MRDDAIVLGIETSCDETAAALVRADRRVLAAPLFSQLAEHAPYGGVVPEIAARAHVEKLDLLVAQAMARGRDRDSATWRASRPRPGPGLIGGLMVGLLTGKTIALVHGLPLVAVNHLEAHALTARLVAGTDFPYLLLLVSGGHCQLVAVEGVGRYRLLGTTIDDAVGEAFDKVAKMLGLGYPGGPAVERLARDGDPERFDLPRPLQGAKTCDFSFSGLKTAVRHRILELGPTAGEAATMADLCASFQAAVGDVLVDRSARAMRRLRAEQPTCRALVVAGGVAANLYLRQRLELAADAAGLRPGGAAPGVVHRQRDHGGLGRNRAAAARAGGRPGSGGARALATGGVSAAGVSAGYVDANVTPGLRHPHPLRPRRLAEHLAVAGREVRGRDEAGGAGDAHDRHVGLEQEVARPFQPRLQVELGRSPAEMAAEQALELAAGQVGFVRPAIPGSAAPRCCPP